MQTLNNIPLSLKILNNPPSKLFFKGNIKLLDSTPKIAIVGTRKPNPYTKTFVATLAHKIAQMGGIVVSGGALGVDIIAHTHAFPHTIMISPSSLDIIYPKNNVKMIQQMMEYALVLSEYESPYKPHRYSFLERNRLVIALSEYVIIPQADLHSGSMQSALIAQKLQKPLYVLPHRIGESEGTNSLLAQGIAHAIYDISSFIESIFGTSLSHSEENDEILQFCKNNPSFEEAFARFGDRLYEYELEGKIIRESGSIRVL